MQSKIIVVSMLISLFFSWNVSAQSKQPTQIIRGVVTDKASGEVLPLIAVNLLDMPQIGAVSDDEGRFVLSNIPVGRHDLQARYLGYEPVIIREIMVTSAKEVYVDIRMTEMTQELDEIVVKPRVNKEESLNQMALSGARMFSVEEARRYAGGFDDPARLASSFAGVSPGIGNNGISIHGNAPHLLQWRMEDVEIPNPNHFADIATLGGGILSALSSNVLGNSDFFTGAFPAEYGNAVSGVFDMKLRNGNSQHYEHTFQAGVLGIDIASEGPLSKKHNASYIFNYRYSTTGLFKKLGGNLDEAMDFQDLNFKVNLPVKKAGIFSVWGAGLIDKYDDDDNFDKDTEKWESIEDRQISKADQVMGAGGISHRYFSDNGTLWKTTLAATYSKHNAGMDMSDWSFNISPYLSLYNKYTNLVLKSSFNRKFGSRFTNSTGFTYTKLFYNMNFKLAPHVDEAMELISTGDGNTDLIAAYTSSLVGLSNKLDLSVGVNTQVMTLNKEWTLEPRVSLRWQASAKSSFAFAYGLHSRMEKMDVYFVRTKGAGESVNEKLGFTKSHHLLLTYNYKIGDDMNIRIEPYAQFLYDVPVIADSSFSVLNRRTFYVEDPLVNKGKGRNIGVDLTFEKYLTRGLYYMITASVFDSKYCGGDGVWHNTRYNRKYIINGLIGKEWMLGRNKQNVLGVNLKLTLQGGERHSPVDEQATMNDPDKIVQYNEDKAFSEQLSPMLLANYTVNYKINRNKISHEFAIQGLNATRSKEFYGHIYNEKKDKIEIYSGASSLMNVSYKIQF